MVESMKATMLMTRNKGWERSLGLMEESTKACGKMGLSMERENIKEETKYGNKAFGKMAKELDEC